MDDRHARRLLAVLALCSVAFLTGCADFPPRPTVCLTCEEGIENATADGPNVSVASSELGIRVRTDGTSRWTVRAELSGPDVDELRSDSERVSRLGRDSVTGSVGDLAPYVAIHGGNVRNLSATMEGRVLVVSFTVPNAADRGLGDVLLFDYFNTEGRRPSSYALGTDRVVVRGPPGTVVTAHPPEANLSERKRAVVWDASNRRGVGGDTHVAFAPDRRRSTRLVTRATVSTDVAGWAGYETARTGFMYALGLLGATVVLSRGLANRSPIRRVGRGDSVRSRLADRPPVDLLVVAVLYAMLVLGVFGNVGRTLVVGALVGVPLVPVGLFFLLGLSVERRPRASRFFALAIAGAAFVGASAVVSSPPTWKPFTVQSEFGLLVRLLVVLLGGAPAFYVGTLLESPR